MLRALIFDFDGVIIDTESIWFDLYRTWLEDEYNYQLKLEDYVVCVGANTDELFEFLRKEVALIEDPKFFEKRATSHFMELSDNLLPLPGVIDTIHQAKTAGIKIGLCTSATCKKPTYHLKRLGLLPFFNVLATAELFDHIKPAPDPYLVAAQMLKCQPSDCLAIEDAENGFKSAKAAGMPCLVVPNKITAHGEFSGAYKVLSSLVDFNLTDTQKQFAAVQLGY